MLGDADGYEVDKVKQLAGLLSIDDLMHHAYVKSQLRENPSVRLKSIKRVDLLASMGSTKLQIHSQRRDP